MKTCTLWRVILVATISFVAQNVAVAQSLNAPLLDRLTGTWVLRGDIAGKSVTHDIVAQWVLAHQYIQIHETSRSRTAAGAPEYDAIVYIGWNPDLKQYSCLWLDSTGGNGLVGTAFGHAESNPAELAFIWSGKNGDPSLSNTFAYDRATDSWRWTIDNIDKGRHRSFANVKLTRQ
ncbi:hypothetical protein EC912_10648 [Luteibacter rhizovicinus]|uniref:DUF1579 domain-containing protein n=1 Tax=Luteibacter rhizovicinus TaxID=242606 RepID=A0A4R3YKD9_9GAMM|nr:hypothetical protein [Luteibacter rhizovicinus]TCV92710.1 hypothetical protein EC912_10648 [Luteibacter rhizovicinus]